MLNWIDAHQSIAYSIGLILWAIATAVFIAKFSSNKKTKDK